MILEPHCCSLLYQSRKYKKNNNSIHSIANEKRWIKNENFYHEIHKHMDLTLILMCVIIQYWPDFCMYSGSSPVFDMLLNSTMWQQGNSYLWRTKHKNSSKLMEILILCPKPSFESQGFLFFWEKNHFFGKKFVEIQNYDSFFAMDSMKSTPSINSIKGIQIEHYFSNKWTKNSVPIFYLYSI